MGLEIERKFLVGDLSAIEGVVGVRYRQGYLSVDPERVVRVRSAGDHGYLTIKGIGTGPSRPEFEYPIPPEDAAELLGNLALRPLVEKTRYRVDHEGLTWEIDIFEGENAGLVVAEVELPTADAHVELPPWVGPEVTDDPRYLNANLVSHPYREWHDEA